MMFVEVLYQHKEFEDIRIHKSKDRQHNSHKEKKRRTNNVLQNIMTVNISAEWFTLWGKYHDSPVASLLKYTRHNGKSTIYPPK
jgi:hypothetical protein